MKQEELLDNYQTVVANVEAACKRVGRNPDDITIIAVSKTKPLSMIEDAIAVGMTHFGENKPQEIRDKTREVSKKVHWHMIGKLQSNKIKYVIETCDLIHSVDSLKLAENLSKEACKRDCDVQVLLQVNIADEETKSGFKAKELYDVIDRINELERIHVLGLMAIPPFVDNPEDNRSYFRELHEIFVDIKSKNIDNINMNVLSMGMTNDYQVAVEEGATCVRVGTGIFGARDYSR